MEQGRADVQAIGAGGVNQAIKAIIIARGFLQADGLDLICIPTFVTVEIKGMQSIALRIEVEVRSGKLPSGD